MTPAAWRRTVLLAGVVCLPWPATAQVNPAPPAAPSAPATLPGTATAAGAVATPASAPAPVPLAYATVAQALAGLKARDGDGTIVTQADGWTIVNEPRAAAQWSFPPEGHEAYPAVVRRIIRRGPGSAVAVDTASLCEAPAAPCGRLLAQFEALNERIVQATRGRTRPDPQRP